MRSFRALPAWNAGNLDAAILMRSPVWGFRPSRAFRLRVSKVPNPVIWTFFPDMRAAAINPSLPGENSVSTAARASRAERPVFLATVAMSSVLFIFCHLLSAERRVNVRRTPRGVKWIPDAAAGFSLESILDSAEPAQSARPLFVIDLREILHVDLEVILAEPSRNTSRELRFPTVELVPHRVVLGNHLAALEIELRRVLDPPVCGRVQPEGPVRARAGRPRGVSTPRDPAARAGIAHRDPEHPGKPGRKDPRGRPAGRRGDGLGSWLELHLLLLPLGAIHALEEEPARDAEVQELPVIGVVGEIHVDRPAIGRTEPQSAGEIGQRLQPLFRREEVIAAGCRELDQIVDHLGLRRVPPLDVDIVPQRERHRACLKAAQRAGDAGETGLKISVGVAVVELGVGGLIREAHGGRDDVTDRPQWPQRRPKRPEHGGIRAEAAAPYARALIAVPGGVLADEDL